MTTGHCCQHAPCLDQNKERGMAGEGEGRPTTLYSKCYCHLSSPSLTFPLISSLLLYYLNIPHISVPSFLPPPSHSPFPSHPSIFLPFPIPFLLTLPYHIFKLLLLPLPSSPGEGGQWRQEGREKNSGRQKTVMLLLLPAVSEAVCGWHVLLLLLFLLPK